MIISRTPFRISFFGGGTDYSEFYKEYGGSVLSTSFDKYCYVTARHLPGFFDYKYQINYSKIERVNILDEIIHPAVRETMKYLDMREMFVGYDADLPARSGLGSSSSFVVGMLNAFYAVKGKYIDKKRLAKEAIYIERVLCNESGGVQDQIAASYGGFNKINFREDDFSVQSVIMDFERKKNLADNLMLFFTGFSRISSEIAIEQKKATSNKIKELKEMLELVDEAEKILINKRISLNEFGKLLDYSWQLKRSITSKITTNEIDEIYSVAVKAGALGGKLLGAGGGGFMLFYAEKDKQEKIKEALSKLLYVPFNFENEGTKIMYYMPEDYVID